MGNEKKEQLRLGIEVLHVGEQAITVERADPWDAHARRIATETGFVAENGTYYPPQSIHSVRLISGAYATSGPGARR